MTDARLTLVVLVILQILNISEEKNNVRVVIEKMSFLVSVDHDWFSGFVLCLFAVFKFQHLRIRCELYLSCNQQFHSLVPESEY